jgi:hypothetical protein
MSEKVILIGNNKRKLWLFILQIRKETAVEEKNNLVAIKTC